MTQPSPLALAGQPLPLRAPLLRVLAFVGIATGAIALCRHLLRATVDGLTTDGGHALGDDFINFWAAPRLALLGRIGAVYDFQGLHAFQEATLGGSLHLYHYAYPPTAILVSLPFGFLPYVPGLLAWLAGGALIVGLLVWRAWPADAHWLDPLLYGLAIPAMWVNALAGQNGPWIAAILGGGLMLAGRRPATGGAVLALLVIKPHLAPLIPLALLAGRSYRALAGFIITGAALTLSSIAVFGMDPWWAFFARTRELQHHILEQGDGGWFTMISVFAGVRHLPASVPLAYAVHAVVAIPAAVVAILAWRRQAPADIRNSLLVLAALLATPYLQAYDLVVAAFIPLWLWRAQLPACRLMPFWIAAALLLAAPTLGIASVRVLGFSLGPLALLPAFGLALQGGIRHSALCGTGRSPSSNHLTRNAAGP